jgi:hypothetical protein
LLNEQAALQRVATLVASGADKREVVSAVASEVGQLFAADTANHAAVGRANARGGRRLAP